MTRSIFALAVALLLFGGFAVAQGGAAPDPNPAMNAPDRLAWSLFLDVNAKVGTAARFETWASDTDTFKPNPQFPGAPTGLKLHAPIVPSIGAALLAANALENTGALKIRLAPGIASGVTEETRRNRPAFDFIVQNKLYSVTGLRAAYSREFSFPREAMEVKANWVPVAQVPAFTLNRVALADVGKYFYVSADTSGDRYALVSMHVISKLVPNWTWATFENRFNPARCDIIGCHDPFGSTVPDVAPNAKPDLGYPDCPKTPALIAMFKSAPGIGPVMVNYCLKGSQVDFTDNSGLAIRLGNSVTEGGFVQQSSCITCHGRAAWNSRGGPSSQAGFDDKGAPLGPISPAWYWKFTASPPIFQGMPGLQRIARAADFVWSIPFCAYDDTGPTPKPSKCSGQ